MAHMPDDEERNRLGLDTPITRRDFVNGALVGAGGVMIGTPSAGSLRAGIPAPDTFTGYGGVGDYAKANGNTWPVVKAAHRLRDGAYDASALAAAKPAGDFDLVVVGGGIAGLSAAFYFTKAAGPARRVLLLDNHSMLGGEARQNEFSVAGERLLGPQGSNDFAVPAAESGSLADAFFTEFALPREYSWQSWDARLKPLRFARDNYSNIDGFQESQVDVGHFFGEGPDGKALWRRNIWSNGLKDAPFSETARRDLLRWRADNGPVSEAQDRYLDTLTYKDYLERIRGYDPAVTRLVEPIVGLLSGVSADAASARLGRQLVESPDRPMALSFPGGNSPFPRALLRGLLPAALPGKDFNGLMYGRVDFAALDRAQSTRIRLEAMALRVEHASSDSRGSRLRVIYEKGGALFKVGARTVVMASGGWVNKHLLVDMPDDLRSAYDQFSYAPALIVNVALRQWRFLYDLDITACRWFDDARSFGYCCNLRQTMTSGGGEGPPLHPDRPAVLSFYLGLPIPGLPAAEQGAAARAQFLATPYSEFELRIRRQMTRMFAAYGFKPDQDIAAIVLNRWGHARLIEPPGFHYGRDGKASPLERVREGYGHLAIGHSELNGGQHWGSALEYGKKAGERAAAML
jgi:spermidine dehydrogenase